MTTHEDAEKRRETVYALYSRGASLNEIAGMMDIPRSGAQYDINQARSNSPRWAMDRLGTEGNVYGFYREMWDRHLHAYREAWRMYETTEDREVRLKAQLLNQALQCLDRLRALFARMTPQIGEWDLLDPDFNQYAEPADSARPDANSTVAKPDEDEEEGGDEP